VPNSSKPNNLKQSIGCEYTWSCQQAIHDLADAGKINHIQITIPNTLLFHEALDASCRVPTIAHCNLLNVFGENNWAELRAVAQQIKRLNPLHVIEHFTAFRNGGAKAGISFGTTLSTNPNTIEIATDNIKRWQDILGLSVCLENVAVIENCNLYFELMLEACHRTQTRAVVDLPHFFLSALTKSSGTNNVHDLATSLNPIQIHIAGVGIHDDKYLIDKHDLFSPWLLNYARDLFPQASYLTVEQSHSVPAKQLIKYLDFCNTPDVKLPKEPARIALLPPYPTVLVNADLTTSAAKNNGLPILESVPKIELDDQASASAAIDLYDKYVPFFWPLPSVRSFAENPTSSLSETVKYVSILARWACAYQSWWAPTAPRIAHLAAFDSSTTLNFSGFVVGKEPPEPVAMTSVRVLHHSGSWVEAKLPLLKHITHIN
jgi:uncharacterized protein (UPF0276 family)